MAKKGIVVYADAPVKLYGRLSFLKLEKPEAFEEGAVPRYSSTVLLDPADKIGLAGIKALLAAVVALGKKAGLKTIPYNVRKFNALFAGGADLDMKKDKEDGIEFWVTDGDTKEYDGYKGVLAVPAHNSRKPAIATRKGVDAEVGDPQFPYSGCYGYQKILPWYYENAKGKGFSMSLRGVQFAKDGEPFGGGSLAAEDEFEALEDEEVAEGADPFAEE